MRIPGAPGVPAAFDTLIPGPDIDPISHGGIGAQRYNLPTAFDVQPRVREATLGTLGLETGAMPFAAASMGWRSRR